MEDFAERLMYDVHREGQVDMGKDVLKMILLHGIREDCLDMLNLLGKGNISKESFEEIVDLYRRYSRGSYRTNNSDKRLDWDVFNIT